MAVQAALLIFIIRYRARPGVKGSMMWGVGVVASGAPEPVRDVDLSIPSLPASFCGFNFEWILFEVETILGTAA